MKFNFIELIKSAFVNRDQKFRQRLTVFLVCLVIAIFVWFTVKMDNDYQEIVPIPLNFVNPPKSKVLVEVSDSTIFVELSEKGSELLRYRFIKSLEPLAVNTRNMILTQKEGKYTGYILTSSLFDDIGYQHDLAGKVVSISPDTLYLTFKTEAYKRVPVTADLQINTQQQYMVYGNVVFEPDSVILKGPEDILTNIHAASLGTIPYSDLSENLTVDQPVIIDKQLQFLSSTPSEVTVTVPVEKFTEANMEVPLRVLADSGLQIKLFPETVNVNYLVALKDYAQVTPGMFVIVADFRTIDLEKDKKIKIKVAESPSTLKITHVDPEKVEFIIIK